MTYYALVFPGNASIAIDEIRKLIDFDTLNPDGIIKMIDPNESMKKLMDRVNNGNATVAADGPSPVPGNLENAGIESTSMIVNLSTIIFATGAFIVFVLISMLLITMCKTDVWMVKLKAFLVGFKKKMHFNGLIDYLTIGYINFCASTAISIQDYIRNPDTIKAADMVPTVIMLLIMMGHMIFALVFLGSRDKREYLMTQEGKDKFGSLYKDVDLNKRRWNILYYPMFIVKRFFFMFIPVILLNTGAQ